MSEMIERVAKAIGKEIDPSRSWEEQPEGVQDEFCQMARAAIEAMREPTEKVAREAYNKVATDDWLDFLRGYRAMIDAALKEDAE